MLNSNKAQENLGWRNKLDFTKTLEWTVNWQKEFLNGHSPLQASTNQIEKFLSI
jgi:CDP-glucose 4,6-dehydratase